MTEAMAIAGDHATPPLVKCSVENRSLACASATKWPSAVWRRSEAMGEKGGEARSGNAVVYPPEDSS